MKASTFINQPLYSLNKPSPIGFIQDIFFSPSTHQVHSFSLQSSYPSLALHLSTKYLYLKKDRRLTISHPHHLQLPHQILKPFSVIKFSSIEFKNIHTSNHGQIGYCYDLVFNSKFQITGLEILIGSTTQDRWLIPINQITHFGHQHITLTNQTTKSLSKLSTSTPLFISLAKSKSTQTFHPSP